MKAGYWKEIESVPGTGSGNRSAKVPVRGISPLFVRGIPLSGNRTALSATPYPVGAIGKGNSGNCQLVHRNGPGVL